MKRFIDNLHIKKLRLANGMTQKELGDLIGRDPRAISHWETGLCNPRPRDIPKLATALGVTVNELFGRGDPAPQQSDG